MKRYRETEERMDRRFGIEYVPEKGYAGDEFLETSLTSILGCGPKKGN
jgi:hypothetical protein